MKKILLFLICIVGFSSLFSQVSNDDCVNATPVTLTNGSACVTGTTANSLGVIYTTHPCWPTNQNIPEVWYSFVTTGADNVITVTPTGGTPAQQLGVTVMSGGCGGALSNCGLSPTNGGTATTNWTYPVGTTVWINVGSMVSTGGFQLCITSTDPVPAPGNSCATASILCDKSNFSLAAFPNNSNALMPSCFPSSFQRPVFYQFTVGQTGSCVWSADPQGAAEYDWVMYNITGGCPNNASPTFMCNFNYANATGAACGMQTGSTTSCPTSGFDGAAGEFCPPSTVVSGNTYLLIIDNYSDNNVGFNFTWGGTFTIAPISQFTPSATTTCAPPLNVSFTNTSIAATSQVWNFGNGNTSTAVTPTAQTYTASGTYIVSLTTTSATGCVDVVTSNITVGVPPTVTVPTNTTVCAGATVPAAVFSSTPAGATYTWTNTNTAIGIGASGSANIPAFTATNTTGAAISGVVSVTPTLNGCPGAPVSYTITVDPTPSIPAVASQTVCVGDNTTTIAFNPTPITATVNWTNSDGTIGIGTSGSGDIASFAGINTGTTAVIGNFVATPTENGCTGAPRNFSITVSPTPVLAAVASQTVCAGVNTTAISFNPNPVTATVNWTNSDNTIGIGSSGSGNIAAFAGANTGSTPVTGNFVATPTENGCTGTPQNFSITVDPTPSIPAVASQTVCATVSTTAIAFSPTPATATVNWTNSDNTIGIGSSGSGDIAAFVGVNTGATTLVGNFVATPTESGCTGLSQNFSITIDPLPSIPAVTSETICAGASTTAITFNPSPATATVNWTNSDNTIGIGSSGSGDIASFTGINTGSTVVTGSFVATPSGNGCTGTPRSFSITINPTPSIPAIPSQTVCVGINTTAITFNPTPSTATVNWTNSNGTIGVGTSGTGDIAAFAGINSGSTPVVGNFVATPTENGCIGTSQNFAITVNPTPSIPAVTSQTVCAGANTGAIIFNPSPATATVNWTNSDNTIGIGSSGSGDIAAFAGINGGSTVLTGNFVATPTENGCTGIPRNFSITVNPLPSIPAVTNQAVCANSNTSAINFVSTPVGAIINWTNSNGAIGIGMSGTGNIGAFTGLNSGTTAVTGNFTATPTLSGCVGTAQNFTITVNPLPTATIANDTAVCVNGTINFTASGGTGYVWSGPNSFSSTTQNPTLTSVTSAMGGVYTVTVTDVNTCVSTATRNVIVNTLPNATISSNSPVCMNGTINLTAEGGVTYSWSGPNGFLSSSPNPSISPASSAMGGNYGVVVTDANGCSSPNFTTVNIVSLPSPFAGNNSPVCEKGSLTFNLSLPYTSYAWTGPNGFTSSVQNPTVTNVVLASAGTYSVTVTDNNGCTGSTTLSATINPLPSGTFLPVPSKCAPLCDTLVFVPQTNNIVVYSWNLGPGMIGVNNSSIPHCYNSSGTYGVAVTLTDANSCTNTVSQQSWVTVYENPVADFIYSPDPISIFEPSTTFYDYSTGPSAQFHNWQFGDPLLGASNSPSPSFTFPDVGIYDVTLTIISTEGCTSTVVKPVEVLEEFAVYIPNSFTPNGDGDNETFGPVGIGIDKEKYRLYVYDRWGEKLFESTKYGENWDGKRMGSDKVSQEDVYIYKFECRTLNGEKFTKSGHVTLVR